MFTRTYFYLSQRRKGTQSLSSSLRQTQRPCSLPAAHFSQRSKGAQSLSSSLRQTLRPCSLLAIHCSSPKALGIEAASFASGTGFGDGKWDWDLGTDFFERDENLASKDIAESPTATAGTPKESVECRV